MFGTCMYHTYSFRGMCTHHFLKTGRGNVGREMAVWRKVGRSNDYRRKDVVPRLSISSEQTIAIAMVHAHPKQTEKNKATAMVCACTKQTEHTIRA